MPDIDWSVVDKALSDRIERMADKRSRLDIIESPSGRNSKITARPLNEQESKHYEIIVQAAKDAWQTRSLLRQWRGIPDLDPLSHKPAAFSGPRTRQHKGRNTL